MSHSVVIGGAGFVGSWVVEEILKDPEARVTIVDNLLSSERWNVSKNARVNFIERSASEENTFQQITDQVNYVYQLACFHGNQNSIVQPIEDFENGLKTTLMTLEWIKTKHPLARMIYSSAGCAVAEKTWEEPKATTEINSTSLLQDSPYSISKIAGEMYSLVYHKLHGIDIVRVRFQNVFGPREILGAGKWRGTDATLWRNVVPVFIYKSIKGLPLEVNPRASRDFIFVEDIAKGVVMAAKNGTSGDVYNLASGQETKISDLAKLVTSYTNSTSPIFEEEPRSWDTSGRRFADIIKSRTELNFNPQYSLEQGLKITVDWTQKNIAQIEVSIGKHTNRKSI